MSESKKQKYEAPELTELKINSFAVVLGGSPEQIGEDEEEDGIS